jgi:hypothetical protein
MLRKGLFVLPLVFVVGFSFWVLWDTDDGVTNGANHAEVLPTADINPDLATLGNSGDNLSQILDEAPGQTSTRIANDFLPPYQGEDGVEILVLNHATGRPVAGAKVHLLHVGSISYGQIFDSLLQGYSGSYGLNLMYGQHYLTNSDGVIRVKSTGSYLFLLVEKGGLIAGEELEWDGSSKKTVELKPNRIFVVTVQDSKGAAVEGIYVNFHADSDLGRSLLARQISDNLGQIRFEDFSRYLSDVQKNAFLYMEFGIPMKHSNDFKQNRFEITDRIAARGTATLTLPPTGGVRVHVLDEQGKSLKRAGQLELKKKGFSPFISELYQEYNAKSDGYTEFYYIGIGLELELSFSPDDSMISDQLTFEGPTEAGQWTDVDLVYRPGSIITGRLLGPDGNPLRKARGSLLQRFELPLTTLENETRFRADEDGYFRHEIRWIDSEIPSVIRRTFRITHENGNVGLCWADLEAPTQPPASALDFGEIKLSPIPTLLSGRVVDFQGKPISDANVRLESQYTTSGTENWWPASKDPPTTGADGSFLIQGERPTASTYRAVVHAPDQLELIQEVTLGSESVELQMSRAGILAGSVQMTEGIAPFEIGVILRGDHGYSFVDLEATDDPTIWDFRFAGTPDTAYQLMIRTWKGEAFYRSDGLILTPGEVTRPDDLQPLDLRHRLNACRIEVRNVEGELLEPELVVKIGDQVSTTSGSKAHEQILSGQPIDEIRIQHRGYQEYVLHDVTGDQSVVLERAIKCYVQIQPELVHYRNAELVLGPDPTEFGDEDSKTPFDASGRAEFFVPKAGIFPIYLKIKPATARSHSIDFMEFKRQISEAGEVFELSIDLELLTQRIQQMNDEK